MKTVLQLMIALLVLGLPATAIAGDTLPQPDPAPDAEGLQPPPPGREAFYYLVLDKETKAKRPDLTIDRIKRDSLNDLLVIDYFNENATYSNYQRAVVRRAVAQLSNRLLGRKAKLLDVMAFSADDKPVYRDEAVKAFKDNTLGDYATSLGIKPVLPYGQVFINGQLVYDFAVTLNAKNDKDVALHSQEIQSSLQRIVDDLNQMEPMFPKKSGDK